MTLQQLRYIVAIDDYRHFGKAAEACGLTQSTLSLMVKKMEEELDVRIFDREAHPVAPTEVGRKIIDRAKVVLFISMADFGEAVSFIDDVALRRFPGNPMLLALKGMALIRLGRNADAAIPLRAAAAQTADPAAATLARDLLPT